jgi:PIN domain nuclease of toxin-antitoxin system
MDRYLLDTHILIWLLDDNDNLLNQNIRDDIDYFQNTYFVSVESLREIVILQSLKKIAFDSKVEQVIEDLQKRQITLIPVEANHIKVLEGMPIVKIGSKSHEDPFDRLLIAQSIADKLIMISSDKKFPFYKDCGLQLLVNEK